MMIAATSTPNGSELEANSGSKTSSAQAVISATTNPMNIARPPTSGSGSVCTVRSFGRYTQPNRRATRPTTGVTPNVTTAARPPTIRYSATPGTRRSHYGTGRGRSSTFTCMSHPADWYPDPAGDPTLLRWWDGNQWTEHTQPVPAQQPAAPAAPSTPAAPAAPVVPVGGR